MSRPKIIHISPGMKTTDPRVIRARETWQPLYDQFGWIKAEAAFLRTAAVLGDHSDCVFYKDMIECALSFCETLHDVVIVTSDDNILLRGIDAAIRAQVEKSPCFLAQRVEIESFDQISQLPDPVTSQHQGRDLHGATARWFLSHLIALPDFIFGFAYTDLVVSALFFKTCGQTWTMETAGQRNPSCDLPLGLLLHEKHTSSWVEREYAGWPGAKHNRTLAQLWFEQNMPEAKPQFLND